MGFSWDDLAGLALAGSSRAATHPTSRPPSHAIGAMQTQTARSAFLGLAARFPGTTHAEITEAYAAGAIVRGSTIRGTVHTASPAATPMLAAATRVGQHSRWARMLGITYEQIADLYVSVEDYAREWRTPEELRRTSSMAGRALPRHDDATEEGPGRYLAFGHGGLVRRPANGQKWEGQGKPVYGTFTGTGARRWRRGAAPPAHPRSVVAPGRRVVVGPRRSASSRRCPDRARPRSRRTGPTGARTSTCPARRRRGTCPAYDCCRSSTR